MKKTVIVTNIVERAVAQMLGMNVQQKIEGVNLYARASPKFVYPGGEWEIKDPFTAFVETVGNHFKISTVFNDNKIVEETIINDPDLVFNEVVRQAEIFYTCANEYAQKVGAKIQMIKHNH